MKGASKVRLTTLLLIACNAAILLLGVVTYQLTTFRMTAVFHESEEIDHQQRTDLIAKSIRQAASIGSWHLVNSILQNAQSDARVKTARVVAADGVEQSCVGKNCYSGGKSSIHWVKSELYFDSKTNTPMATVYIEYESLGAIELSKILSRYLGAALLFLILVFNVIFVFFSRILRTQISWSIEAVRRISRGDRVSIGPSNFLEREEFASALGQLESVLHEYKVRIEEASREAAFNKVAQQLVHDIRSPLAALDAASASLQSVPEDRRIMIRGAISRIHDIAHSLIEKTARTSVADAQHVEDEAHLISGIIEPIVSEKRLQYRSRHGVDIQTDLTKSYGIFAKIQTTDFKRILSNLINNAVESITDRGSVAIRLSADASMAKIIVSDSGRGIASEILPKLLKRGATFGKAGGLGLGLAHAKEIIEGWGGSISLASHVGKGTTVEVQVPKAQPPSWFVPVLEIRKSSVVAILDDDTSIHQIWKGRFESAGLSNHDVQALHFSSGDDLVRWHSDNRKKTVLYLCDFELLGQNQNGLQLIKQLGIEESAILVSSRFEEREMRAACEHLGVRMIPKGLAGFVPIAFMDSMKLWDAILIDDEKLVRLTWEALARDHHKKFLSFQSPDEFFSAAADISRSTPVYVDSNLGGGLKGEDIAKEISALGFREIYITTGLSKSEIPKLSWITGVVGKSPPWRNS